MAMIRQSYFVSSIRCLAATCAALLPLALLGCGGVESHAVTGKVTLDGAPLSAALVSFVSQDERPINSVGVTDGRGNYQLQQTQSIQGLPAGTYRVHISTHRSGDDIGTVAAPERVPECYNRQSTLQATVKNGDNQIDFALSSAGESQTQ